MVEDSLVKLLTEPGFGVPIVALVEHAIAVIVFVHFISLVRRRGLVPLLTDVAKDALAGATALPGVASIVEGEVAKEVAKIEKKMHGDGDPDAVLALPAKGRSCAEVLALCTELKKAEDANLASGKQWGGIYHRLDHQGPHAELEALQAQVTTVLVQYNSNSIAVPYVLRYIYIHMRVLIPHKT